MVPLVARTELNVPGCVPAVNSPAVLTFPPLATTDQVGVMARTFPLASLLTGSKLLDAIHEQGGRVGADSEAGQCPW